MSHVLINGADNAPNRVLLTHGAGAGMEHSVMNSLALGLADEQIQVIRFEFPFMQKTRADGRKRPPDREPALLNCWREMAAEFAHPRLFLAGKSMGGRMASLVADELAPAGLVLLGFPFTPPGKPDRFRGQHLATLATPTLLAQGERDNFGNRAAVAAYDLAPGVNTQWVKDGDHGFSPRKSSGTTLERNLAAIVAGMRRFVLAC
ncbi:alpha/beta fold hydrolase [Oceanisphaera arctica]|uniref:Alpha/beta hydrolase n=1 Tax=Oceanisphaera arctica TaxID=641510 RepID=A0A2P5TRG0_9GAMM|nr:alpha/beta fold hydrolase [Oceanisphaera arctica]PPL18424.1 alpha/beta hydrolase [Oceanisphaera arctica]GHA24407.1 alpha/beta hydrolase [Oceanisphaera arctica]